LDKKKFKQLVYKYLKEGDLKKLENIMMEEEMQKHEKIEILKILVEKGEYEVDVEKLVDKMLQRFKLESEN
jgi:anti-sigma28 factor (negative regulator of flagellin synthesis)